MTSLPYVAVYIPPQSDSDDFRANNVFSTLQEAISVVKKYKDRGARFKCFGNSDAAIQYAKTGSEAIFTNQCDGSGEAGDVSTSGQNSPGHLEHIGENSVAIISSLDVKKSLWSIDTRNNFYRTQQRNDDFGTNGSSPVKSSSLVAQRDFAVGKSSLSKNGGGGGVVDEKPAAFAAPSRAELTRLRKAIEANKDKEDEVLEAVLANPRFLINYNNDCPTILFEGCRYNAMHIAAKAGNVFVCELILRLFGTDDSTYVRSLYPDDSLDACDDRRRRLFDAYVNTVDSKMDQTPLHFAAKNANHLIVRLLLSLPICDRNRPNRYGETAAMLATARRNDGDAEVAVGGATPSDATMTSSTTMTSSATAAMTSSSTSRDSRLAVGGGDDDDRSLLATSMYVALYRTSDFSTSAIVQPPCVGLPPTNVDLARKNNDVNCSRFPGNDSESADLMAYAGPMTATVANRFFSEWSSKKLPTLNSKQNKPLVLTSQQNPPVQFWSSPAYEAKRSDWHKGAERLGRELAHRHKAIWREFWRFLNKFIDLASIDGLMAMEEFFKEQLSPTRSPVDAESLTEKLLALPSPFFDNLSRTPKKRQRKKLEFDQNVEKAVDECFYDAFEDSPLHIEIIADNVFKTPPESPPTFFIGLSKPSKADHEAFVALEHCDVDCQKFPLVARWKDKMMRLSQAH